MVNSNSFPDAASLDAQAIRLESGQVVRIPVAGFRSRLENGYARFPDLAYDPTHSWFPSRSDIVGNSDSHYDIDAEESKKLPELLAAKSEARREFQEEYEVISSWLDAANWPPAPPPSDEKGSAWQRVEHLTKRQALAYRLWSRYACPLRLKNGYVCRIAPPTDFATGLPRIRAIPAPVFLEEIVEKLGAFEESREQAKRTIARWQVAVAALGMIAFVLLIRLSRL